MAILAEFTVLGPDSMFYTSCMLLNLKFFQLKQEIEVIFDDENDGTISYGDIRSELALVVDRHIHLLRGAELLRVHLF
ncbi:unnamed protein product, partial [Iphiclides podalirius]